MSETSTAAKTPSVAELQAKIKERDERIEGLCARLTDEIHKNNGETVGAFATLFALVALVVGILWLGFRGSAFGVNARHNAEREATAFFRRTVATPPVAVYCADRSNSCELRLTCSGLLPDGHSEWACCDDDDPKTNDGCTPAARPSP